MTQTPGVGLIVGVVVILVVCIVLFKACWRNPEPDEALIISGTRKTTAAGQAVYRVVVGHGAFVMPLLTQVRRIGLKVLKADLKSTCVTSQGVEVTVEGVVMFRVGNTDELITAAAQRFLDQQGAMVELTVLTFDGHLRTIVGGMTIEELLTKREVLTTQVRQACSVEMLKLGLSIDSLQITKITDPTGYIDSIAAPHVAAVQSTARIAQAQRDLEAARAEQLAAAGKAEAERDSATRQAAAKAEVDKAEAEAAQAGPLAQAIARQKVTEAETAAARLAADLTEQRLQTDVRKPADAEAYRVETLAQANRMAAIATAEAEAEALRLAGGAEADATRATGQAQADVRRATGEAEAAAIKARAEALREGQQAVIAQQLAERFPEIVAAAAAPLGNIKQLTVLNGADGVTGIVSQVLAQAFALFPGLQEKLGAFTAVGSGTQPVAPSAEPVLAGTGSQEGVDS